MNALLRFHAVAVSAAFMFLAGCSTTPPSLTTSSSSDDVSQPSIASERLPTWNWLHNPPQNQIAVVPNETGYAVLAVDDVTQAESMSQAVGQGAANAMRNTVRFGCVEAFNAPGAAEGVLITCPLSIIFAPFSGLVGAGVGAVKQSITTRKVDATIDTSTLTNTEFPALYVILDRITKGEHPAKSITHGVVALVPKRTIHSSRTVVSDPHANDIIRVDSFDTIIVISVTDFGAVVVEDDYASDDDPWLRLLVATHTSLYNNSGIKPNLIGEGLSRYLSPKRKLSELTADNGELVRQELQFAYLRLAEHIIGSDPPWSGR